MLIYYRWSVTLRRKLGKKGDRQIKKVKMEFVRMWSSVDFIPYHSTRKLVAWARRERKGGKKKMTDLSPPLSPWGGGGGYSPKSLLTPDPIELLFASSFTAERGPRSPGAVAYFFV